MLSKQPAGFSEPPSSNVRSFWCCPMATSKHHEHKVVTTYAAGGEMQEDVTAVSTSSEATYTSMEITNITEMPSFDVYSTSGVLYFCKKKVLVPYLWLLAMLGWRPLVLSGGGSSWLFVFSRLYVVLVMVFNALGYVLQLLACYRSDHPNIVMAQSCIVVASNESSDTDAETHLCPGTSLLVFISPALLHQLAYLYAFYMFRISENEQIQTLMERVFLQTFHTQSGYLMQPRMVRVLRFFLITSVLWVLTTLFTKVLHLFTEQPQFLFLENSSNSVKMGFEFMLIGTLLWHDIIHIAIIISYTVQCQLVLSFLHCVAERTTEKSISLQDAIKDILESTKMVKHLNDEMAIPVCILQLISGSMSISGLLWLSRLKPASCNWMVMTTAGLTTFLWLLVFLLPFIMASRLTASLANIRKIGQIVRARPFGYQNASQQDLDSFLVYTTSIKSKAKLFRLPIQPRYLIGLISVVILAILVLLLEGYIDPGV